MRPLLFAIAALSLAAPAALLGAAPVRQPSFKERLASCDPAIVHAAAVEILRDPATLREPIMLFNAAFSERMAGQQEQAGFLFLAGLLRTNRQLLFKRGDRVQLLTVMQMTVGPLVLPSLTLDPTMARRVVRRVIDWDRQTPDPYRDGPEAKTADFPARLAAIDAVLAGFPRQLESDRAHIDAAPELQAEAERQVGANHAANCRPGR
jgi:hypothetical protein